MAKLINYQGSLDTLVWRKEKKELSSDYEVIVPVSHEAVFVREGRMAAVFSAGRYNLLEDAVGEGKLFKAPDEKVDCVVYFVKKEGTYNIKWSLPAPITLVDPVLKIPVEINLAGVFAIKIISTKQFLERLLTFTKKVALEEVKAFFRERMILYIKDQLLNELAESRTSVLELNKKIIAVSKNLEIRMRYVFESFGVSVEGVELKKAELLNIQVTGEKEPCAIEPSANADENAQNNQAKGETLYCNKCGEALPPMSNFCFKCGEKIK